MKLRQIPTPLKFEFEVVMAMKLSRKFSGELKSTTLPNFTYNINRGITIPVGNQIPVEIIKLNYT